MFAPACSQIRECIYGLMGVSQVGPGQVSATNATGFMIYPGVLATAAHFCHVENDASRPIHSVFEVIRSPDIGQNTERATLLAADTTRDIALIQIEKPRSSARVTLNTARVPTGTSCGSLGFPLASVVFSQTGRVFNLTERFQAASISAYRVTADSSGRTLNIYETDALMYRGSSGCPGFLVDATVFGMHVASILEKAAPAGNAPGSRPTSGNRLAISMWVPAADIRDFAVANNVQL